MEKCPKCQKTFEISYPYKDYCKCISDNERKRIQDKREIEAGVFYGKVDFFYNRFFKIN